MIDKDQLFFLSLLQTGLWGRIKENLIDEGYDWNKILTISKQQTVVGIISEAISKLPIYLQPPEKIKEELKKLTFINIHTHHLVNSKIKEIFNFYCNNDIRGVILKGQSVAQYYSIPELRQCGDIDFYVGEVNYNRAKVLAIKHWDLTSKEIDETIKHFSFVIGNITVELHKTAASSIRPWQKRKFQNCINCCLENPQSLKKNNCGLDKILVPSLDFNAFFIFYHAYRHILSGGGIGLRQISDWALVLHKSYGVLDLTQLKSMLDDFGLMRPWQVMSHILVDAIGLPKEEIPFYTEKYHKISWRFLKEILEGGNFGRYSKRYIQWVNSKSFIRKRLIAVRNLTINFFNKLALSPIDVTCIYLTKSFRGIKRLCAGEIGN